MNLFLVVFLLCSILMFFQASDFLFLISSDVFFTTGIQVHHLTPNSILHILIFVHLCEAFLGIEPHFDLFQYFFHLKPHPNDSEIDVVGGAGLQFCQGKKPKYIPYELSDKVIDWKEMWFYVRNESSSLPRRTPGPPVKKPSWNSRGGNIDQVNFLLGENREVEGGSQD